MAEAKSRLLVAIDTAGDLAGLALCEAGALLSETTWRTRQNHSRELLPALEWLLGRLGRGKEDIGAMAICLGPGSYAGLRVGLSTAKALAYALDLPIVGVGRLAADAAGFTTLATSRVIPVQAAGRAELAWAAYAGEEMRELVQPRLSPIEGLLDSLQPGDLVCAELKTLPEAFLSALAGRGATAAEVSSARVIAVAAMGQRRLDGGEVDNADTLVPLYLRAPAIGPQS